MRCARAHLDSALAHGLSHTVCQFSLAILSRTQQVFFVSAQTTETISLFYACTGTPPELASNTGESSTSRSMLVRFRSSNRINMASSENDTELSTISNHPDLSMRFRPSRRRGSRLQRRRGSPSLEYQGLSIEPNTSPMDQDFYIRIRPSDSQGSRSQRRRGSPSLEFQGLDDTFCSDSEEQLLMVLRIMGLCSLQHFLIPAEAQWNKRRGLGEGASFAVEEASLPVWRVLSHETHRRPHGRVDLKQISYFTDHTGTRWDSKTRVAFKVSPEGPEGPEGPDFLDLISELQVLCHPPLYNHPNIVQLLGIAWVRQPGVENEQQRLRRDQPTTVTEYASHGSLHEFLRSPAYTVQRVSLKTKLRLCMDLLEGMLV